MLGKNEETKIIKLEGYDTGMIYEFNSLQEMIMFIEEISDDYFFEQNMIFINNRPAFITR